MDYENCRHLTVVGLHDTGPWNPRFDSLGGLVVKGSALRAEDPRFDSRLRRGDFSGSSHTGDLNIGTPGVTLPGGLAWKG